MLRSLTAPCERQIDTGLVFDALMNAEGCACCLFRHSCSSLVMRPSIPNASSRDQNPRMLCDICPCHFHQKAGLRYWYFGCFLQFISLSLYWRSWIEGVSCFFGRDIDQIYVFSTERVLCRAVSSRRESSEYLSHISQVKPCVQWPLTFHSLPFLSFRPFVWGAQAYPGDIAGVCEVIWPLDLSSISEGLGIKRASHIRMIGSHGISIIAQLLF